MLFTWIDSGTTTINSVIADIGGGATTLLAKAGSGTLVLGGSNTYSGGTALDQGVLNFANGTLPHASGQHPFLRRHAAMGHRQHPGHLRRHRADRQRLHGHSRHQRQQRQLRHRAVRQRRTGQGRRRHSHVLGANTYSGATTISAGTVQLGNGAGGNDGSIAGNIINNAALVYDLFGSQTYGGAISGTGSLTQAGTAALVLTGSNTYSGGTTISAGVLLAGAINSLSPNSAVTVSGGTLDASGFRHSGRVVERHQRRQLESRPGQHPDLQRPALLHGTLNVSGTGTLGSYPLLTYA